MNTTFIIRGGAGKVITSIPALEKYSRLNPNDDFKILSPWESVFFSHPLLQHRAFPLSVKGTFEQHIKNNIVISPEPYENYYFYNQQCNLIEAFDKIINSTQDHSDLNISCLHISNRENALAQDFLRHHKENLNKNKVVMFQPFGSGCEIINNTVIDQTSRSLSPSLYLKLAKAMSEHAVVLFASSPYLRSNTDTYTIEFEELGQYHRAMISLMYNSDFFVGTDSVAQHVAYALNVPGVYIGGATHDVNFTYPEYFDIIRKDELPVFTPWRTSEYEQEFTDRLNNTIMNFSEEEENEIVQSITDKIING